MGRKMKNIVVPRQVEESGVSKAHRMEGKVRNRGIKAIKKNRR